MPQLRGMLVGFLGVGRMGSFMARNLLKAGATVIVVDPDTDAIDKLKQQGASRASSPAELASMQGMSAIISMLPSPEAVQEAYLGKDGLLSVPDLEFHPHLLIDSSTIDPVTSKKVSQAAEKKILHPDASAAAHRQLSPYAIDAPVSGGIIGAEAGTLSFMAGGTKPAVDAATSLLLAMGQRVLHCGGHGNGQAAKLANNLVLAIEMAAVAEGLEFGRRLGLDPKLLSDVFNSSSAACWASQKYNPVPGVMEGVPSSRGYKGGFSSKLMVKDLNLALQTANSDVCTAPLPMTSVVQGMYERVAKSDSPPPDFSAIYKYIYKQG